MTYTVSIQGGPLSLARRRVTADRRSISFRQGHRRCRYSNLVGQVCGSCVWASPCFAEVVIIFVLVIKWHAVRNRVLQLWAFGFTSVNGDPVTDPLPILEMLIVHVIEPFIPSFKTLALKLYYLSTETAPKLALPIPTYAGPPDLILDEVITKPLMMLSKMRLKCFATVV